MTLLVRIVGGTERTPYETNCCNSLFVCSCTCECVCVCAACSVQRRLRERTSDRAPAVGNCGTVNKVGVAGGQMSNRLYYRPLYRGLLLNSLFESLACR